MGIVTLVSLTVFGIVDGAFFPGVVPHIREVAPIPPADNRLVPFGRIWVVQVMTRFPGSGSPSG
jgi:hypothetical protein